MAKTRLTNSHRDILGRLAQTLVECPVEKAAFDAAYGEAAPIVRKMVEKALPPADMKILKKYEAAHVDDCIRITLTAGGYVVFKFDKSTGPLTTSCKTFLADDVVTKAYESYKSARDTLDKAREAKLQDYYSLIHSAKNFEDVVEIWPEADSVRERIGARSALVTLNPEVVARIQQDVVSRQVA